MTDWKPKVGDYVFVTDPNVWWPDSSQPRPTDRVFIVSEVGYDERSNSLNYARLKTVDGTHCTYTMEGGLPWRWWVPLITLRPAEFLQAVRGGA